MKIKNNNINLTRSGFYGKEVVKKKDIFKLKDYLRYRFPTARTKSKRRSLLNKKEFNIPGVKSSNKIHSLSNKSRYNSKFDGRCLRCGGTLFTIPRFGLCTQCEVEMNQEKILKKVVK